MREPHPLVVPCCDRLAVGEDRLPAVRCRAPFRRLLVLRLGLACLGLAVGLCVQVEAKPPDAAPGNEPTAAPPEVDFDRHIRPILSNHCFKCHGPDARQRLDTPQGLQTLVGGVPVVVAGDPQRSPLVQRITAADPQQRMPPAEEDKPLSREQIALLQQWIAQGARWEPHWAFVPPQRPAVPAVRGADRVLNPIDAFVLQRLESLGLGFSPQADRATLLRRVTLDLTGLPPTPQEVDAFLADSSPLAYERAVDRLLASPRYGEHMAAAWLDLARYADTNGYQTDGERSMWRWRDWVIEAYNAHMRLDQFTIEQLAGDLLPQPTLSQRIATGFNRNHRGNAEGGIVPEEYAVEYVVDRVETTFATWLGLTMGCARCHDHKFDPIAQREFYQVFAFFNNVPEKGKAVKFGNSPPMIAAPTRLQQERYEQLTQQLEAAQRAWDALQPQRLAAQRQWEAGPARRVADEGTVVPGLLAHFPLEPPPASGDDGADASDAPRYTAGMIGQALAADGLQGIDAGDVGDFGFYDKFTLAAWVFPLKADAGTILARRQADARSEGYSLELRGGRSHVDLVKRWLDDAIRVHTAAALPTGRWQHVTVTYDGSRVASGIAVYVDGRPVPLRVDLDELNQSFQTSAPLRIGAGGAADERFQGRIDEVRLYSRALQAQEAAILSVPQPIAALAALPPEQRTAPQEAKLTAYFLHHAAPDRLREAYTAVQSLHEQRAALQESFPTVMVMEELPEPRSTFVLHRGQYDQPGEAVEPDVPACLGPFPHDAPRNRLGLARWLLDPRHPLTARVAVNRLWEQFFGLGLVKTAEDFGTQGERPSHPQLLDYLATELVRSGWNVQHVQRLIATSATYRQSSRVTPALAARDPENRLLARGPRVRLPAEVVRDQALYVSGLLVERVGGPSVRPYQPPGLWEELSGSTYVPDEGAGRYRRSLYTFWKRTAPPPALTTFDAPARETCVVQRARTNTPLQALLTLNEWTFIEAARHLAQRMLSEGGPSPEARLAWGFRLVAARPPTAEEARILSSALQRHQEHYRAAPEAARALVSGGDGPQEFPHEPAEWAAYTAVANMLLNLDEVLTKE